MLNPIYQIYDQQKSEIYHLTQMRTNLREHKTEDQELDEILKQTFANTEYVDEDIQQFINDPSGNYIEIFSKPDAHDKSKSIFNNPALITKESTSSIRKKSDQVSDFDTPFKKSFHSSAKDNEEELSEPDSNQIIRVYQQTENLTEHQSTLDCMKSGQHPLPQSYIKTEQYFKKHKYKYNLSEVKQRYPYFAISQPSYTLTKGYEQNVFLYNTIKNVNIRSMDVGYCFIIDNFKIAIGTDDGRVALFQKTYTKPVHIFEAFSLGKQKNGQGQNRKIEVLSVQWSENLQYLAVSSSSNSLKVYQFKQTIAIEQASILRMLKEPIQIISLTGKQLKKSIISMKFISQSPFLLILCDEDDDMQVLQYKLHFLNFRPYLKKLDLKFNDVFQVDIIDFIVNPSKVNNQTHKPFEDFKGNPSLKASKQKGIEQYGTLIAISSQQYVTIALLKPYFQVIMVYDKQKHGKNMRKEGYGHIKFRSNPLGILIVWDKFAHILDIQIDNISPLKSNIRSRGMQMMPETTLLAGLVTSTLMYQISESGLKIYSTQNFSGQKNLQVYKQCIYQHPINFFELPFGFEIQQTLVEKSPPLGTLRLLSSFIKTCNRWLFLTTNTSLFSVRIQNFQEIIINTIENLNNWKIGLQLLHDAYLGKFKIYDNMTKEVIQKIVHQYSNKYINFLSIVIGNQEDTNTQDLLWFQQTVFLFNILIETEQFDHLFNKILVRLSNANLGKYICSLEPFIMLNKVYHVTPSGLQLLFAHISNTEVLSILLISNIIPEANEVDLPHMINQILLKNKMYKELISINFSFHDFFTPFVVIVSYYEAMGVEQLPLKYKNDIDHFNQLKISYQSSQTEELQKQSILQEKPIIKDDLDDLRQIIAYLTYKTFVRINRFECCPINPTSTEKKHYFLKNKQFIQIFLPLFQTRIIHLLLDSKEQQIQLFGSIIPEMFTGQCLEIINIISNKKFNTDLMSDIVLGIPFDRVRDVTAYWLCLIQLYNKSVIKMDVFMGLKHLIMMQKQRGQKSMKSQMRQQVFEQKEKRLRISRKNQVKSPRKQSQNRISDFIKHTIKVSSLKITSQFEKLSERVLQQFYYDLLSESLSFESSHIGLLIIISIILGSGFYIRVILAMMVDHQKQIRMENPKAKKKSSKIISIGDIDDYNIYIFVDQTIEKFSKSERDELKTILYENIEFFIDLDCQKLCNLIAGPYIDQINKFVGYLPAKLSINNSFSNYTGVVIGGRPQANTSGLVVNEYKLIKLIEGLLHKLSSTEIQNLKIEKFESHSEWMLQLRLQFLKLLAITGRQHQILNELKKENYPIDQSLQICKKFGVIDAQAYLLVKSGGEGEIASAIKLYFKLISEKIKYLKPECMPQFKQYLISVVKQCMRVCQSLHSGLDHFNQQWFLISLQLFQIKKEVYHILAAYTGDLLNDVIEKQIYPILAQRVVKREQFSEITKYLKQSMEDLDLAFLRVLSHQIMKNYAFQKIMLQLTQQSFIESEIKQRNKIYSSVYRGLVTNGICQICYQDQGIIIHYNNCGHQIHPSCGQDVKVCYICACRAEKIIEKQIDIVNKIRNELYSQEVFISGSIQNQKQKIRINNIMEKFKAYENFKIDIQYL